MAERGTLLLFLVLVLMLALALFGIITSFFEEEDENEEENDEDEKTGDVSVPLEIRELLRTKVRAPEESYCFTVGEGGRRRSRRLRW